MFWSLLLLGLTHSLSVSDESDTAVQVSTKREKSIMDGF